MLVLEGFFDSFPEGFLELGFTNILNIALSLVPRLLSRYSFTNIAHWSAISLMPSMYFYRPALILNIILATALVFFLS